MVIKTAACVLAAFAGIVASLVMWAVIMHLAYGVDSHGPYGWTVGIQPPHIAAGFGIVRDHFEYWWQTQ